MRNILLSFLLFLFILSFGSENLFGQIQLTQQDLQGILGKKFKTVGDTGLVVNVGSAGENQIWDLSGLSVEGIEWITEYLTPANTPFAEDFPTANWAEKSQVTIDGLKGTIYHYRRVEASSFASLGDGMVVGEYTNVMVDESENIPLPLVYGAQWVSESVDTLFAGQGALSLSRDRIETIVDGWGKVKLPSGEYDALRLRDNYFSIWETWFGGQLMAADTTVSIGYNWVSKNILILASIGSVDGEEDPNFTMAGEVFIYAGEETGTGLAAVEMTTPEGFQLCQNYPNPFNPLTTIDFSLPVTGNVELTVHDTQGKRVATLVNGVRAAGTHSVTFDAHNFTSGIYYYTVKTEGYIQTRKMMLVK